MTNSDLNSGFDLYLQTSLPQNQGGVNVMNEKLVRKYWLERKIFYPSIVSVRERRCVVRIRLR